MLRSEQWRATMYVGLWSVMLLLLFVRRLVHSDISAVNAIFYPLLFLLLSGIIFQVVAAVNIAGFVRRGQPLPRWRWMTGVVVDLAIPVAALAVIEAFSPTGHAGGLTAPALLVLPMVIMLTILRLRPWVSFLTGLGAAVAHWILVGATILTSEVESHHIPTLLTYGVMLLVTGAIAALISREVRGYVMQAVDEAVAAEQKQRELDAVERDLSVARDIQQGLMPSTSPSVPGFDIAGMARPAQQTGGDYYDWQEMPDGRLVVALADVTGHGIGPALVMAVCRAYARAAAPGTPNPAALLEQINGLIYHDLASTGRFITMVIAIVSPDGRVDLVSAGHGPSLLYRAADQKVEWFGGSGLPLGIDEGETYGPHRPFQLEPGDSMLLLTDGFVEWARTGDKKMFGVERLCATLRDQARGSAKEILTGVDAAVQAFAAGAPQLDDTTAVVIKRTA
jgi:serine phosphatase RsbU (regulator of sigma subunit)